MAWPISQWNASSTRHGTNGEALTARCTPQGDRRMQRSHYAKLNMTCPKAALVQGPARTEAGAWRPWRSPPDRLLERSRRRRASGAHGTAVPVILRLPNRPSRPCPGCPRRRAAGCPLSVAGRWSGWAGCRPGGRGRRVASRRVAARGQQDQGGTGDELGERAHLRGSRSHPGRGAQAAHAEGEAEEQPGDHADLARAPAPARRPGSPRRPTPGSSRSARSARRSRTGWRRAAPA